MPLSNAKIMIMFPHREEVMNQLEPFAMETFVSFYGRIDTNWQPTDFCPRSEDKDFAKEVKEIQERAKALSYEVLAVLIGNMVTEEGLPTYESALFPVEGVHHLEADGWSSWVRSWTAEENRHGDALNRYLYLCGRVDMKQLEITIQYLLADGFNTQTMDDPYRSFIYTSFQERATNISHRRTAALAKKAGDEVLAKICGVVASDEARHELAYKSFVAKFFELDPDETMLAFEDMMRKKIAMPAHYLREQSQEKGSTFTHFAEAAQRIGVYTAFDYAEIIEALISFWNIQSIKGLKPEAEKARDYICALPARYKKLAERYKPAQRPYKYKWILE